MAGPNPYTNPSMASAAQDLGIGQATMNRQQTELAEMKRRKKLQGSQAPLGSASAAALIGAAY